MNILLFGRGVIATLYGWAFEKAGHTVTFYVRPGRSAEYGSRLHLDIFDLRRGAQPKYVDEDWTIRMVEELPADHSYDLILVSVQEWMFAEVAKFLESRVGHATILIFSNFWRDPEQATRGLPKDQVAWGFPFGGGSFHSNVLRGALYASVPLRNIFSVANQKRNRGAEAFSRLWIQDLREGQLARLAVDSFRNQRRPDVAGCPGRLYGIGDGVIQPGKRGSVGPA